jgi:hypothetical protein
MHVCVFIYILLQANTWTLDHWKIWSFQLTSILLSLKISERIKVILSVKMLLNFILKTLLIQLML